MYLAGALGGMWAFVHRGQGRANFLYALRITIMSVWKTLKKRTGVKGVKGGDVWLFVGALAVINAIYERDGGAVTGGAARKVLCSLRGGGWRDLVKEKEEEEKEV